MKNILIIIITLLTLVPNIAVAQESTPSGSQVPESEEEIERVQRIKDIVASKVAELNLVEKRGIIATVKEISSTEIEAVDYRGNDIVIDVDELTSFDFEDEELGITDLEFGVSYSFVGLFNKDSGKLLARFISPAASIPNYVNGAISKIDEENFQIEVVDAKGQTFTIDIETATDTMIVDEEGQLNESGFSELAVGQRIIVAGYSLEENEMSATRVMHFEQIPPSTQVLANLDIDEIATESSEITDEELN